MVSEKQKVLVDAYLSNGFKKGAAMLAAGYTDRSSKNSSAMKCAFNATVMAEIERRQAPKRFKAEVTREWIIERLARRADADNILAKYKRVNADGHVVWDFSDAKDDKDALALISEITEEFYVEGRGPNAREVKKVKMKTVDAEGALTLLARHLGMLNDKLEVSGSMSLVERLQRGRARAAGIKQEK